MQTTTPTFADDIRELMAGWNKIEADAKREFPNASPEKLFEICKSAMNHALRIKTK